MIYRIVFYNQDKVDGHHDFDKDFFHDLASGSSLKPIFLSFRGKKYVIEPTEPIDAMLSGRMRAFDVASLDWSLQKKDPTHAQ